MHPCDEALRLVRAVRPQAGPNVGFFGVLIDREVDTLGKASLDLREYAASELQTLEAECGLECTLDECREAVAATELDDRGLVNAMVWLEERYATRIA